MMYEDDIKKVDEWFEKHTENFGTCHSDDCYSISEYDLQDFTRFLGENFPDMIGIRCYIGKDDSTVWFFKDDLERTPFL